MFLAFFPHKKAPTCSLLLTVSLLLFLSYCQSLFCSCHLLILFYPQFNICVPLVTKGVWKVFLRQWMRIFLGQLLSAVPSWLLAGQTPNSIQTEELFILVTSAPITTLVYYDVIFSHLLLYIVCHWPTMNSEKTITCPWAFLNKVTYLICHNIYLFVCNLFSLNKVFYFSCAKNFTH